MPTCRTPCRSATSPRAGVAVSALRFYEAEGLISATRSAGGQRRYARSFAASPSSASRSRSVCPSRRSGKRSHRCPGSARPPLRTGRRLAHLARCARRADQVARLVRDDLTSCIGCGCLSLHSCRLYNPDDRARGRSRPAVPAGRHRIRRRPRALPAEEGRPAVSGFLVSRCGRSTNMESCCVLSSQFVDTEVAQRAVHGRSRVCQYRP